MWLSVGLQLVLFTTDMKVVNNTNVCVTQFENLFRELETAVSSSSDVASERSEQGERENIKAEEKT